MYLLGHTLSSHFIEIALIGNFGMNVTFAKASNVTNRNKRISKQITLSLIFLTVLITIHFNVLKVEQVSDDERVMAGPSDVDIMSNFLFIFTSGTTGNVVRCFYQEE